MITQDVKRRRLRSAYAVGAFNDAKQALEREGYRVISLEEQAGLRMNEGAGSIISRMGNWVKEGVIYAPGNTALYVRDSPIIADAKEATDCHINGEEYFVNIEKHHEQAQADRKLSPEKRRVIIVNSEDDFKIPTNRFNENALTLWAFQDKAEDYGNFLRENGVDEMPVWMVNSNPAKPFARQLWLYGLGGDNRPGLDGDCKDLDFFDYEVRGVRVSDGVKR